MDVAEVNGARAIAGPRVEPAARRGSDYSELSRRVKHAGLLNRRGRYYAVKITSNILVLGAGWVGVVLLGHSWWQLGLAAFIAVMSAQVAFIGHDAGHRQIFATRRGNDVLGIIHANVLSGLSYGWWIGKHNRHHANPNHLEKDPDVRAGALVYAVGQAGVRRGLASFLTRSQAYLFFPMLALEGLHLRYASVCALVKPGLRARRVESWLLLAHGTAYVAVLLLVMSPIQALVFAAVQQGVFGIYLGCSFAPNHKGMPTLTEQDQLDYLRKQVLTSRNVRGGVVVDFVLGGLNYQIEHHLFPSMPRPSLRRSQRLIREFCAESQVPYVETSLFRSYSDILRHLHQVGEPLRRRAARAPA